MSTQLIVSNSQTSNYFFNKLPKDITLIVLEYLDDKSPHLIEIVLNITSSCKAWREDPDLADKLKTLIAQFSPLQTPLLELSRQHGYPQTLIKLFQKAHTPIFRLPFLNLSKQMGNAGYISFLEPQDLPKSIMRFRDRLNRFGIALTIRAGPSITRGEPHEGVFAFFPKGTPPKNKQWCRGESYSGKEIQRLYQRRHNTNGDHPSGLLICEGCPSSHVLMIPSLLSSLLKGEDPDFSLPKNTPQEGAL